jgi:trehalose-6-phosphatase
LRRKSLIKCELKRDFYCNKNKERVGEGYGMEFSYQLISKSFTKLNQKKIQSILQNSYHKLFIFNLNTIFTNLNANTEKKNIDNKFDINNISISDSYMDYNKKVTNILNNLSQDKNNIICLFSYDSKNIFNEINLNPINFYFVAEDGLIIKPINEINFKNVINIDNNWKSPIKTLFKNFINKTGCGNISVKEFSISLKYKDIGKGDFLLGNELKFLVENFLDKKKFDIILEKNNLEVKIKEANNFKYNYINEIIKSDKNIKFIFALNTIDKKADEFFDFLNNKKRCINDNMENINLITAIIGRKNSKAYYYLKDLNDFINIFDLQKI